MAEKILNSRIINKHDTAENWSKAVNFIPKQGEIIVYDIDSNYTYERIKLGDGSKNVNALPFVDDAIRTELLEQIDAVDNKVDAVSVLVGDTAVSEQIDEAISKIPEPTSIIDVISLPTENIDENVFYRLLTGSLVNNQYILNNYTVHCVEALPEIGEPATNADNTNGNVYYNVQDGNAYGYVTNELGYAMGVPSGWYPAGTLLEAFGFTYGGVITDIMDDPSDNVIRLLLGYVVCSYKEEWEFIKTIGWAGTGDNAEVFNHRSNKASGGSSHAEGHGTTASGSHSHAEGYYTTASGTFSHAEGYYTTASCDSSHAEGASTTASGYYSHAEGHETTASGSRSHAEGYLTTASGDYSHAEGVITTASGSHSHAEGCYTTASGHNSHAEGVGTTVSGHCSHVEGFSTIASGEYQHVQGRYNVDDPNSTYAHIVGNGDRTTPANAHTIDWNGNAWFAGGLKVGGTGQDDENAKEVATKEYVDGAIATIPVPDVSSQIEAHNTGETSHNDIRTAIGNVSSLIGDTAVSEQISNAIDEATADDFGIYVQAQEPTEAVAGDIWIDTVNDPSYIPPTLPEITEADNGKVLMVVNGKLQLVNLNLSVDANGVLSV